MKSIGSESLSGREHFACGAFPFQGGILHAAVLFLSRGHFACGCAFPFQGEHFACGFPFPGGAFRMRQVRGGEAFIVAKAIVPSSRSSPPGHAAVLCYGMCYFSDGVMDSTMLDIASCADISN